jgi:hypothetical protein
MADAPRFQVIRVDESAISGKDFAFKQSEAGRTWIILKEPFGAGDEPKVATVASENIVVPMIRFTMEGDNISPADSMTGMMLAGLKVGAALGQRVDMIRLFHVDETSHKSRSIAVGVAARIALNDNK